MQNRVCSLFAGIGGICQSFKNHGFDIVYANEIDKYACQTYRNNYKNHIDENDINKIDINSMPNFDILSAGFPCQPFSIAGEMKGLDDIRGNLFFSIVNILSKKLPQIILLENVPNLENIRKGYDFKIIISTLQNLGYMIKYHVLSSHEHGNIPQCRKRIFILGFLDKTQYNNFIFPGKIPLTKNINDIINRNIQQHNKYYYTNKSQYFKLLSQSITDESIYQLRRVYVRKNQNNLCPTLTANMGCGGHNVPIIKDKFGIRKLTPIECLMFQGFDKNFVINVADNQAYKQAGNSVTIPLITRLINQIKIIL